MNRTPGILAGRKEGKFTGLWCSMKKEYPQFFEKFIKIPLLL
jgi:hypothetical protein